MKTFMLKRRLFALALLAAFVVTLFAPAHQAEAATLPANTMPVPAQSGGATTNVNWNGGPQ